ncbi:MAG: TerB family tellurite resistance protein [Gemmatimonadota bacterium]|nr:MAG: TerB family tellurite resistance protein [Gemmatimonadota bacterium]
MLDGIRSFFSRNMELPQAGAEREPSTAPAGRQHESIHVAACALLLELAHADDEFAPEEKAHIEEALGHHFDLDPDTIVELIRLADEERRRSVDLYQFTRLIADAYDTGQKMVLLEVMWRVVYADGELARHESYLMRKISHLLGLKPGYLAEVRRKVTG